MDISNSCYGTNHYHLVRLYDALVYWCIDVIRKRHGAPSSYGSIPQMASTLLAPQRIANIKFRWIPFRLQPHWATSTQSFTLLSTLPAHQVSALFTSFAHRLTTRNPGTPRKSTVPKNRPWQIIVARSIVRRPASAITYAYASGSIPIAPALARWGIGIVFPSPARVPLPLREAITVKLVSTHANDVFAVGLHILERNSMLDFFPPFTRTPSSGVAGSSQILLPRVFLLASHGDVSAEVSPPVAESNGIITEAQFALWSATSAFGSHFSHLLDKTFHSPTFTLWVDAIQTDSTLFRSGHHRFYPKGTPHPSRLLRFPPRYQACMSRHH